MEIVDNRALLLNVRHPARITAAIPRSKQLDDHQVLVKWGLEEARVLKNLNVKDVPSPILGQYGWPGQYTPFDHQKTTAAFLTMHQRAFCFNEQGTAKTGSAIWASDFLLSRGVINRVLVICPLSIMDSAWRADIFRCAMHRTVDIAHGNRDKRKNIINHGADYVIINFDGVEVVKEEIQQGGFDLIIVDECSAYKNSQSKRWKTLSKLIEPHTWLWMMTGTPAAQSPVDAYGLAKLVNPRAVPRYQGAFKEMVMYKITRFKWTPKPNASEIVHSVLQPAIRYTKEECLDLPELVYTYREVEMTAMQKKYYDKLKREMVISAAGESISAANAAVAMNKLLQVAGGSTYSDSGETVEFDIKKRFKVLLEVIEETNNKVLLFVPYRHTIERLSEMLAKQGISNAIINGKVSANERTRIFNEFQTTDTPRVLVIQPQAAAHGVTLTAADTVVWWSPVPSLETYAQANARVHRSGQKHRCTVIQLEGSSVEKRMYKMLNQKIDIHTKMIDLYKKELES